MDGIRAKLAAMRDELSAAEKREETAKIKTRDVRERMAKAEDNVASLKRKMKLTQLKLEQTEDLTDEKLDKLERLNKSIYENETCRRQLERKEMKEDNTLIHLESRQKSRWIFAQEAEQRQREAFNKLRMLEAETAKVEAKIATAKSREKHFKNILHDAGRAAGSLAKSEELKQAKIDECKERCRRLNERKERVLITAECLERKANQLEKDVDSLRTETRLTRKRGQEVKREHRNLLDEMNTYP